MRIIMFVFIIMVCGCKKRENTGPLYDDALPSGLYYDKNSNESSISVLANNPNQPLLTIISFDGYRTGYNLLRTPTERGYKIEGLGQTIVFRKVTAGQITSYLVVSENTIFYGDSFQ